VTAGHLGDRIARLRRKRGMTQEELAEQAGISVDVVRKLEQHRKDSVRLETLRKLADGLHTDSASLLGETAAALTARRSRPEIVPIDASLGEIDRRTLIGTVAGAAVAVRIPDAKHVDPALIPYFEQQLAGHYRADMLLGPRALIATVTAQCDLIGQLVDSADRPTRQRMAKIAASFAAFAAWLHLDAGDAVMALRWHDVAQEFAHRSHDREAVACALVDRAMAYTDRGTGSAVVDLCEAALTADRHLSPELRVFALQQQAHGASLLGDRQQVDTLLDKAGRLLDRVDTEVWGTACQRTPHYVEVQRATLLWAPRAGQGRRPGVAADHPCRPGDRPPRYRRMDGPAGRRVSRPAGAGTSRRTCAAGDHGRARDGLGTSPAGTGRRGKIHDVMGD